MQSWSTQAKKNKEDAEAETEIISEIFNIYSRVKCERSHNILHFSNSVESDKNSNNSNKQQKKAKAAVTTV